MKGSDIVSAARQVLNDPDNIRWSDDEFVLWLTAGCLYICLARPDSCAVNATVALAAGAKQSLSSFTPPGLRLLDIMGLGLVDRDVLDAYAPGWLNDTPGTPVNYVYDNRDPKTFYVHPPATAAYLLEGVQYVRTPLAITMGTMGSATLTLDDIYFDPLLNYVLFRCYAKDAAETHNAQLAASYLEACIAGLGTKTKADVAQSPDMNNPGGKISAGTTIGGP